MQNFSKYYRKTDNVQTEGLRHIVPGLLAGALMLGAPLKAEDKSRPPTHQVAQDQQTNNINIVAATLVGEAGGEGQRGMHAVLNVIMNRARGDFSKASEVCLRKKQFSMWNDAVQSSVISRAQRHPNWKVALALIQKAKDKKLPDITKGATHYYAHKKVTPYWAPSMQKTVVLGNHTFLKPKRR